MDETKHIIGPLAPHFKLSTPTSDEEKQKKSFLYLSCWKLDVCYSM